MVIATAVAMVAAMVVVTVAAMVVATVAVTVVAMVEDTVVATVALVPSITTGTCAPAMIPPIPTLDTVVMVATVVVWATVIVWDTVVAVAMVKDMVKDHMDLTAAATAWEWDTAAAAWEDTAAVAVATTTGGTIKHLRRYADCLVSMGLKDYLLTRLNKKCFN
jgi:hypothetical protein